MWQKYRAYLAFALIAVVSLALLALVQSHPADFAFKWYWQNNGVGNYVADITVAVLAARKMISEWKSHRTDQKRILEHLDILHRHHKIGAYAPSEK